MEDAYGDQGLATQPNKQKLLKLLEFNKVEYLQNSYMYLEEYSPFESMLLKFMQTECPLYKDNFPAAATDNEEFSRQMLL